MAAVFCVWLREPEPTREPELTRDSASARDSVNECWLANDTTYL